MLTYLLPVDGSQPSDNAVRHLIRLIAGAPPVIVHLLNVRSPSENWEARSFLTPEEIADAQQAEGLNELQSAQALLDAAGIPYHSEIRIGAIAQTIADYATEQECDAILMGCKGHGGLASLLLGSETSKVVALAQIPVTLVK